MNILFLIISAFDAAASFICYQRGEIGWGLLFSLCAGVMFVMSRVHEEDDEI